MITSLSIQRFKPFPNATIAFKPLTYIFGENGIGKSSIAQAILLLKQSIKSNKIEDLILNGDLVRIGNGIDALYRAAEDDTIRIELCFDLDARLAVTAQYVAENDVLPIEIHSEAAVQDLDEFDITYISANRVGPALLSKYSHHEATQRAMSETGDNALGLLLAFGSEVLEQSDPRIPESSDTRSIKAVFDSYISQISSGAGIELTDLSNIDGVTSTFSFKKDGFLTVEGIRPTNVGFGLSYAASIIVACLIAKKGDLLIIENPEAHLHTKGQRAIANLLAATSTAGIQVICETHSREVIYHTRGLVDGGSLDKSQVTFNYVQERDGKTQIDQWFPITEPIGSFGGNLDGFLEIFGGATDFVR